MKNFNNTVAVRKRTQRVIATTNDNWGYVRLGSSIRFDNEGQWYEVGEVKKNLYIKEFEVEDKKVKILGNEDLNFLPNDSIKITYKEYAIYTIAKILAPGSTFYVGEVINVLGGEPAMDNVNGISLGAKLKVSEVDYHGGLVSATIEDQGQYIKPPGDLAEAQGRSGKSAMMKMEYKVLDQRAMLNRTIKSFQDRGSKTILFLDFTLPEGVERGKISAEKWEMTLCGKYLGETGLDKGYEILKDFVPGTDFPLLSTGSNNPEQILNLFIKRVANRLGNIEGRLERIERKIRLGN